MKDKEHPQGVYKQHCAGYVCHDKRRGRGLWWLLLAVQGRQPLMSWWLDLPYALFNWLSLGLIGTCGEGQCRVYLKNYASAVQDILSVAELIICDHKKLTQKHTKIRLWCCHVHLRQRSRSCRAVIIDIIVGRMFRSLSLSRTRVVKQFSFSMIKKKSCLKMQLSYVNSTKSYEALRVLGLGIKEYE